MRLSVVTCAGADLSRRHTSGESESEATAAAILAQKVKKWPIPSFSLPEVMPQLTADMASFRN